MTTKLKRGTIREDGMVFWAYHKTSKNGEYWVTPEKFNELIEKDKESSRAQYRKNPEKAKERRRARYKNNPEKAKEIWRAWREKNRGYSRDWYKRNRKYYSDYLKSKRETNPLFKLRRNISSLIGISLRKKGFTKRSKTASILGCSYMEFFNHIESKFQEGMTWENRSEWHIDHIIPLASAKTEEEIIKLNHYTNLQPLWAKDNLKKGAKII
jgi:hypothetical protein